jgi:hypothetical protein
MTVYTPTYRVTIAGVVQTDDILSGGTITYGRNDFLRQHNQVIATLNY